MGKGPLKSIDPRYADAKTGGERARDGSQSAGSNDLDDFLASVERKAYRIAYYAFVDEQIALDVVQDTMLKLVEKYRGRPPEEWPALFFTILNNRITDVRRWRRLREAGGKLLSLVRARDNGEEDDMLDAGLGADNVSYANQPESAVLGGQLKVQIDRALTKLSKRQRDVFLLREWQGFNVRDTAAILGCSEGSVKQHHFRAMQTLRAELEGVWQHD